MPEALQTLLMRAAETVGNASNEAEVCQAVVVPVLQALGWDPINLAEFAREFPVSAYIEGRGRVDIALRGKGGNPLVFVEAKNYGKLSPKGEKQLFKYANGQGVPLLIHTDGDTWDFYLSMAAGIPTERRFYRAELSRKENIPAIAQCFESFLRKGRVLSGEARIAAEDYHRDNQRTQTAKCAIPMAWQAMLQEQQAKLSELLVEEVENLCGTRPELADVEEFLGSQAQQPRASQPASSRASARRASAQISARPDNKVRIMGYVFNGQRVECDAGNKTLAKILEMLHERDPGFMPRFADATRKRTRRVVAQNRDDLNDDPRMVRWAVELNNGWWMTSHIRTANIRKWTRKACEIAGIRFGEELTLIE